MILEQDYESYLDADNNSFTALSLKQA